jgi:membrane protease YdiL (CAAX protease family)
MNPVPTPPEAAAFAAFIAPAAAKPALWRTIACALLAVSLWLFAVGATLPFATRTGGFATPTGVLLFLASFLGLAAGVALAARLLQSRSPRTLLGRDGFRPRAFGSGVAVVAVAAVPTSLALAVVAAPERQTALAEWAAWLPLALPAILVQSIAEELAFRGFLLQSLAARFCSPLVWWLLPAVMFGALHWNPAELGPNAPLGVLASTLIGLALADATVRTGHLSAAIGLHFSNNIMAMLVIAMPSPISGLALFVSGVDSDDVGLVRLLLVADLTAILLAWGLWRAILARRRLHSRGAGSI